MRRFIEPWRIQMKCRVIAIKECLINDSSTVARAHLRHAFFRGISSCDRFCVVGD
jgi:hypothetical protein